METRIVFVAPTRTTHRVRHMPNAGQRCPHTQSNKYEEVDHGIETQGEKTICKLPYLPIRKSTIEDTTQVR